MSLRPPNSAAGRGLRRVLLAVHTYAAYGQRIVEGILQYAEMHAGWEFQIFRESQDPYQSALPDGVIAEIFDGPLGQDVARMISGGTPAVLTTSQAPPDLAPRVMADNLAVGATGADHLLDLGFDRLGFLATQPRAFARQRQDGFVQEARQRGVDVDLFPLDGTMTVNQWVQQLSKPIGIMAAEDMTAVHLANVCREMNIMVPEQVAILGVDNDELACRMTTPPLSSIDHGTRRIGFEAAALLDRLMDGQAPPGEDVRVPPEGVIVRQSTSTLAIEDVDVARAVRFIRENIADGIGPKDVIAALPVARRTLETGFRRCLGRTIGQEVMRVRIARVKHLLIETELAMPEICELAGFSYPSQLSKAFKREVGQAPSDYRRAKRL
ncbi:MAG: substrate-binding domain-containing protein [Phycisphaerae bacterium]